MTTTYVSTGDLKKSAKKLLLLKDAINHVKSTSTLTFPLHPLELPLLLLTYYIITYCKLHVTYSK